jgi:FtsH-binding integral membrane protein
MHNDFQKKGSFQAAYDHAHSVDVGLRKYLLSVYNYMFLGLGVTAITAYLGLRLPILQELLFSFSPEGYARPSGFTWLLFFAQLGIVFYLASRVHTMSVSKAQGLFWFYAGLMGLSLAPICIMYTGASLFRTFLVTSATFGSMSLYGYATKRDLSSFSSFFTMGLLGLMIAMVVNIFLQSAMMDFVLSAFGVLLFTGLTAYDTQRIKALYFEGDTEQSLGQKAVLGALTLYLNFINLFLYMLRFLGDRR